MILWPILALMTAAAIAAVIWPLFRGRGAAPSGSDTAVYRDQLDELERDLGAGLIGKAEGEAARLEISRRLLAAADADRAAPAAANLAAVAWRRRAVSFAALLLLPAGAFGLYFQIGAPKLATTTVATARNTTSASQRSEVEALVARVEAHLQSDPNDGRGWEVLAPVYLQLGRYSDSVNAWRKALKLLGETADRDANLGEALMAEANGIVTADAKAAFVRAVKLDGTNVSARYYLGIAAEQDGDRDKAAKIWRQLLAEAPPNAHWTGSVRAALARVEGKAPAKAKGPTPEQMAAAEKQPPEQQTAMIRGMVERLAKRLKKDGSDLDGWLRLVRSYKVLGEQDKVQAAIADARQALAADADKLKQFNAALTAQPSRDGAAPGAAAGAAPPTAAGVPPGHEQGAMIQGMVERLAARLKQSGSDPQGWLRLVRSYKVLGEQDKAQAAIADARQALAADADKLKQFNTALAAQASRDGAAPGAAAGAAPPTAAPPTAAGVPPGHEQGAMIQGMVERLAARLKQSGSDPQGWLMLTRSYLTLGEKDKATAAIKDARQALASSPDKLAEFNEAIKRLNIKD